jgi:hypothetical protein
MCCRCFWQYTCVPFLSLHPVENKAFSPSIIEFQLFSYSILVTGQCTHRTYINSHITQLRPAHSMVQVVLAEVILGQVRDVGKLHMRNVRRSKHTNVHFDLPQSGVPSSLCSDSISGQETSRNRLGNRQFGGPGFDQVVDGCGGVHNARWGLAKS